MTAPYSTSYSWVLSRDGKEFPTSIGESRQQDLLFSRGMSPNEFEKINSTQDEEPRALVLILKYIDQLGLESGILKGDAEEFLKEVSSWHDSYPDFSSPDYKFNYSRTSSHLFYFLKEIPSLDDCNSNYAEESTHKLSTPNGDHDYFAFVTGDGNLAFVGTDKLEDKKVSFTIYPQEIDHVIRGLFRQFALRPGGVRVPELVDLIKYRFSEKFKEDLVFYSS